MDSAVRIEKGLGRMSELLASGDQQAWMMLICVGVLGFIVGFIAAMELTRRDL